MLSNALLSLLYGALEGIVTDITVDEVFNTLFNNLFSLVTQPLTFAWAAAAQTYLQALGMGIVILVILVKALHGGIIRAGTSEGGEGFFGFVIRNLWPPLLVAFSPFLISQVTGLVGRIMFDLSSNTEFNFFSSLMEGSMMTSFLAGMGSSTFGMILYFIVTLVILYYTLVIIMACLKRQFQLCFLSILAPLVAAVTISENNAGDFVTLVKEMLGIGIITVLQILALESCYTVAMSLDGLVSQFAGLAPFVIIAAFGAIKRLPQWIERYTLAPSVSGGSNALARVGGMAASAGARSAISSVVS